MSKKIAAFGEVMMRLEPPDNRTLAQSRTLEYLFSGTGVNVLSGLAHFGYETELLSTLPDNALGEAAKAYLQSLGISTNRVVRNGEYLGMYFLEKGFGVRPSKVTYTNRKESSFCVSRFTDYNVDDMLKGVDLIHFCGISLAITENVREAVVQLAQEAKKRGIMVCFDCNYRPKLWGGYEKARPWYENMLQLSDICLMTEKDATLLLGMHTEESEREQQVKDLLPKVAQKYGISAIAGTIRHTLDVNRFRMKGYLIQKGEVTYSKPYEFEALERIGGGDGFTCGLIHGLYSGMTQEEAVNFAMASGVYAHTTYGDSPVASVADIEMIMGPSQVELQR